jgi:hypothetical protein
MKRIPPARSFNALVERRVAKDPAFGEALPREGIDRRRRFGVVRLKARSEVLVFLPHMR